jgi:hypothetical protein
MIVRSWLPMALMSAVALITLGLWRRGAPLKLSLTQARLAPVVARIVRARANTAPPDNRHRRPSRSSPLEPSPSNRMAMCR